MSSATAQPPLRDAYEPVKMLVSFHYYRDVDFDALLANFAVPPMVFADSGAFSAMSQGAPVYAHDYAEWLHRWKHYFTVYANLDVIRDPAGSQRNQERLEREGLQPIPVFHTGSPFSELDKLAERYPYIALGGMVGQSRPACLRWAATCMKRTEKQGTRFHGFGMTSRAVIERLPWYTVDSSSWIAGARYGNMSVYDGREWHKATIGNRREIAAIASIIRSYGMEPDQFADSARYKATRGHVNLTVLTALSWRRYERRLQQRNANLAAIYHANAHTPHFVALDKALAEGAEHEQR